MSKPRLLERVISAIRVRQYSISTERAYVGWICRFVLFHGKRHPAEMQKTEIESFLSHLATKRRVSPATQNQALQAILFLYRHVFEVELPWLDDVIRAKPKRQVTVRYLTPCSAGVRHEFENYPSSAPVVGQKSVDHAVILSTCSRHY